MFFTHARRVRSFVWIDLFYSNLITVVWTLNPRNSMVVPLWIETPQGVSDATEILRHIKGGCWDIPRLDSLPLMILYGVLFWDCFASNLHCWCLDWMGVRICFTSWCHDVLGAFDSQPRMKRNALPQDETRLTSVWNLGWRGDVVGGSTQVGCGWMSPNIGSPSAKTGGAVTKLEVIWYLKTITVLIYIIRDSRDSTDHFWNLWKPRLKALVFFIFFDVMMPGHTFKAHEFLARSPVNWAIFWWLVSLPRNFKKQLKFFVIWCVFH